jgi:5-hydroxyisourate hydrolase
MVSMGRLTTHLLDTANGVPAANVAIRLYGLTEGRPLLAAVSSNKDGRTESPLLDAETMRSGEYELEFDIGAYFQARDADIAEPAFLNTVVIRFAVRADEHYHVPLLFSPWSYSTYRGS